MLKILWFSQNPSLLLLSSIVSRMNVSNEYISEDNHIMFAPLELKTIDYLTRLVLIIRKAIRPTILRITFLHGMPHGIIPPLTKEESRDVSYLLQQLLGRKSKKALSIQRIFFKHLSNEHSFVTPARYLLDQTIANWAAVDNDDMLLTMHHMNITFQHSKKVLKTFYNFQYSIMINAPRTLDNLLITTTASGMLSNRQKCQRRVIQLSSIPFTRMS